MFFGTSTQVNGKHTLDGMRDDTASAGGMKVSLCRICVIEGGGVARGRDDRVFRGLLTVEIVHNPLRRQWNDNVRSLECLNVCKCLGTKFPLGHQRCCMWGGNPQKGEDDPSE